MDANELLRDLWQQQCGTVSGAHRSRNPGTGCRM
jgi:hypothetical protein